MQDNFPNPTATDQAIYRLAQAARLAQVRLCTARIWMGRGRTNRLSRDLPRSIAVGFLRAPSDHGSPVTFPDLLTLRLVRGLRAEGFSRLTLRHVTAHTAARFGSRTPLVMQRFRTEGARALVELEGARRRAPDQGDMEALQHFVAGILERALFRDVDWQDGAAARWWPLGHARCVLLDPTILAGAPHIAGTRCTTATIAKEAWMARGDEEMVAAAHHLPVQQVRDAVRFEADRPRLT